MNLIKYTLPSGETRVWNTTWFLYVDHSREKDRERVQITTAIAPSPAARIGAGSMIVTKELLTINLFDEEARLFMAEYGC